jgi:phospholipase D1/2
MEIMKRADAMMKILSNNPYKAYTNEKKGNLAHWFADGEEYFKDLQEKLMQAKETIFITDWWLSPEVWLTRPVEMNTYMALAYQKQKLKTSPPYSRLMDILYACANRGVKVYVLVYAECSLALTLNSEHSAKSLSVHENIQVERHPLNCTDLLWSHHEKLVVIDQIIGYVGGLDLCWGRYDTHDHPIYEAPNEQQNYYFPGIDYSNARIRDFDKVQDYLTESCDRKKEIRMPWHDVHSRLIGPVVADIARHFVERWNFSRFGTGAGITDIKQNASVTNERTRIEEKSTLDEELDKKKKKPIPGGFLMGIINQVNEKEKREKEMQEMQGGLTPDDENKDTLDNSRNNMTSDTTNKGIHKNLFASMRPGGLKSIG